MNIDGKNASPRESRTRKKEPEQVFDNRSYLYSILKTFEYVLTIQKNYPIMNI